MVVRRVVNLLPTDLVRAAHRELEEAQSTLAQCAEGSSTTELPDAAHGLEQIKDTVGSAHQAIEQVRGILCRYLVGLGAEEAPQAPAPAVTAATEPTRSPSAKRKQAPDEQRLSRERVQRLQTDLPSPVAANTGSKTHGRWVDEHGRARSIVSGHDQDAAEAQQLLKDCGIPVVAPVTATSHVEIKLAARMLRERRQHADVVINNQPCRGRFGCDTLLPILLPDGYSLTVHGPGYTKTFTGGATPWWR